MIQWDDIKDWVAKEQETYLARLFEQGGSRAQILGACVTGDADYARQLLGQDSSLASIPTGEVTPIRLAAYYGHRAVAGLLIQHGAPVNQPASHSRDFPLHLAAANDHADVVRLLLDNGANVDSRAQFGRTPLLDAAKYNRVDVIRELVAAGADLEARGGEVWEEGRTALQEAVNIDSDAVEELVRAGANVNAGPSAGPSLPFQIVDENAGPVIGDWGARPLYQAVCLRSPKMVNFLLDHGADINALSFGWSALHAAVAMPDTGMVELLIRRGADPQVKSDVKSPLGEEYNHRTPTELLAGFRRSGMLLRKVVATG
jgi:ankyrin repeat protein